MTPGPVLQVLFEAIVTDFDPSQSWDLINQWGGQRSAVEIIAPLGGRDTVTGPVHVLGLGSSIALCCRESCEYRENECVLEHCRKIPES